MGIIGIRFSFLICGLFLLLSTVYASEKGSAFYGFLEDPINSRSIGMGTAGTALHDNRGFNYYNPALPGFNSRSYLSFDYGQQYDDMRRANPELALVFPSWFIALAFQTQSTGSFTVTDEHGIMDGSTENDQSSLIALDGGYRSNSFAFGVALDGIQDKIAEYKSYGVIGNIGALFDVIPEKLSVGAAVLNIGRHSLFLDSTHSLNQNSLPLTVRAGVAWSDYFHNKYKYVLTADAVYSKNYQKLTVPVGAEFWLLPVFALRIGKRFNYESDLFSLGIGLKLTNIGFDAAFTPTNTASDLGMKWSMGLTYFLATPKKKSIMVVKPSVKTADSTKSAISESKPDTVKSVPNDTIPVFKKPIEKKIIKKKISDSSSVKTDSVNIKKDSTRVDSLSGSPHKSSDTSEIKATVGKQAVDSMANTRTIKADSSSVTAEKSSPDSSKIIGTKDASSKEPDSSNVRIIPSAIQSDTTNRVPAINSRADSSGKITKGTEAK